MDALDVSGFDHTAPVAPQIFRLLREQIVHNVFAPGSRISEIGISRAFAVSRQPVREAFIKLAEQRLISIRPQRGTIIRPIDHAGILDAQFVRETFELEIVRILARRPAPATLAALGEIISAQCAADGAPRDFIRLDEAFHATLADGAGKGGAWRLIEGLKSQMDRVRFLSLGTFPAAELIAQHRAIVAAIAAGDVAGAEAATRQHLRQILSDLPTIVAAHPQFFATHRTGHDTTPQGDDG